jgi:hypothetical protein
MIVLKESGRRGPRAFTRPPAPDRRDLLVLRKPTHQEFVAQRRCPLKRLSDNQYKPG